MNSPDLVSVVVPAYNHERYVQETLQSVVNQTYPNLELIIANDGSTDNTHEKIEEMLPLCKERFSRVEYRNKPNEGVIKSLNLCLGLAHGNYVYFIASDDVAAPTAIDILHDTLSTHAEYGLAVGDNAIIDSNGSHCYWGRKQETIYEKDKAFATTAVDYMRKRNKDINFNSSDFGSYPTLLKGNHVPNGFLIRKTILDQIGGYSEKAPLEDYHLMLQIAKISKLKYVDQVLFSYRWHQANTIKQKDRMKQYMQKTLELEIPYAKQHGLLDRIKQEKTVWVFGLRVFEKKKSHEQMKLLLLKVCIFKRVCKNNQLTIYLLGVPLFSKAKAQ